MTLHDYLQGQLYGMTEQTYDTDLEVVSWPAEEGLLFCSGSLFRGHCAPLFCGEYAGDVEGPTGVVRGDLKTQREKRTRVKTRREEAGGQGLQPSESISLHRIFTLLSKTQKPPISRRLSSGVPILYLSRLLHASHGIGIVGMPSLRAYFGDFFVRESKNN